MSVEVEQASNAKLLGAIDAKVIDDSTLVTIEPGALPERLGFRCGKLGSQEVMYPEWDFIPGAGKELDLVRCTGRPARVVLVDKANGEHLRGQATVETFARADEAGLPWADHELREWGQLESPFCVEMPKSGSAWLRVSLSGYAGKVLRLPTAGSSDELTVALDRQVSGHLVLLASRRLLGCTVSLDFPDRKVEKRSFRLGEAQWRSGASGPWQTRLAYDGPGGEQVRVLLESAQVGGGSMVLGEAAVPATDGFRVEVSVPSVSDSLRVARLWVQCIASGEVSETVGAGFSGTLECLSPSPILAGQPGIQSIVFIPAEQEGLASAVLPRGIVPGSARIKLPQFGYCHDVELSEGDNYLPEFEPHAVVLLPSHELSMSDVTLALTLSFQGCDGSAPRAVPPSSTGEYPAFVLTGALSYRRIGTETLSVGSIPIRTDESLYEFGADPERRFAVILEQGSETVARSSDFWSALRVTNARGEDVPRSMMPLRFHQELDLAEEAWVGVPDDGRYFVSLETDGEVLAEGSVEVFAGGAGEFPRVRLSLGD